MRSYIDISSHSPSYEWRMSDTKEESVSSTKVYSSQNDFSQFDSGSSSMYEVAEYLRKQKSLSESELKSLLVWFDQEIEKVG